MNESKRLGRCGTMLTGQIWVCVVGVLTGNGGGAKRDVFFIEMLPKTINKGKGVRRGKDD